MELKNLIDDKVREILEKDINERWWIDYKLNPYSQKKKSDFIKDVIAMLNSEVSFGKDKYIIFGVVDETLFKHGLDEAELSQFKDDHFQGLADLIIPKPVILAGTVSFDDKNFGFIYISKDNTERVYEVRENYPKDKIDEHQYTKVHQGQAWTKQGSKNRLLTHEERESITLSKDKMFSKPFQFIDHYDQTMIGKSIVFSALIGAWDEFFQGDIDIIEQITDMAYSEWIKKIQLAYSSGADFIKQKGSMWKINDRKNVLKNYITTVFDTDINRLYDAIVRVLTYQNPRYDLDSDKRYASEVYGKKSIYSQNITESLSATVAIIKSMEDQFSSCSRNLIRDLPFKLVKEVLTSYNWKIWANLEWSMLNLAEAAPKAFLTIVNEPDKRFAEMFSQGETGLFTTYYIDHVINSLVLIAWYEEYIVAACVALAEFAKFTINDVQYQKLLNAVSSIVRY